jgi:hypothetical protein
MRDLGNGNLCRAGFLELSIQNSLKSLYTRSVIKKKRYCTEDSEAIIADNKQI